MSVWSVGADGERFAAEKRSPFSGQCLVDTRARTVYRIPMTTTEIRKGMEVIVTSLVGEERGTIIGITNLVGSERGPRRVTLRMEDGTTYGTSEHKVRAV